MSANDLMVGLRKRILALHPELEGHDFQLLGQGQNNLVLRVGGLVFRVARYDQPIAAFDREAEILRWLAPRLPLPIPQPVDVLPGLLSYRLLAGTPLDRRQLAGAPVAVQGRLAGQLGSFLRVLHESPAPPELVRDKHAFQLLRPWRELHRRAEDGVRPLISVTTWWRIDEHFQSFFSGCERREIVPVVVHGDFGAGNILWNASTQRATGVIDFSSTALGDPAVDLAAASTIAPGFLSLLAAVYPLDGDLAERARFYRGTFALQDAVFGDEHGDESALEAGLASLELQGDRLSS